jgi:5'(3')-deoxyribonucleotidase
MNTLFIDLDNVLVDFTESVVRYYKMYYGEDREFTSDQCKTFDIFGIMFSDKTVREQTDIRETIFNAPGFWADMEPYPNSQRVFGRLANKFDVFIVTAPWPTSKNCIPEKIEWVENCLGFEQKRIIFTSYKHLLLGDVIIDDNPKYISNNNCGLTMVYDYPYNRQLEGKKIIRVHDWLDIESYFFADYNGV